MRDIVRVIKGFHSYTSGKAILQKFNFHAPGQPHLPRDVVHRLPVRHGHGQVALLNAPHRAHESHPPALCLHRLLSASYKMVPLHLFHVVVVVVVVGAAGVVATYAYVAGVGDVVASYVRDVVAEDVRVGVGHHLQEDVYQCLGSYVVVVQ
eukprot:m.104673 g.104673  ORF g.104673 m.104673 type:complete len:151 (-) comp13852_c0_seq1:474-926(-)